MSILKKLFYRYTNAAILKFRDPKDVLITFADLEKIPLDEMVEIVPEKPGAIKCTRISSPNDSLMFTVTMKKGEFWENHHHDTYEIILVAKGKLMDENTNIVAEKAQTLTFKPYQTHHVVAKEDCLFYVEFKNPRKIK